MIRPLLSRFETFPVQFCKLSDTGKNNLNAVSNLSFYYANKVLMVFTFVWLSVTVFNYSSISQRPLETFEPAHITGILLMPHFPQLWLFYSIGSLAALLTLLIFLNRDSVLNRVCLAFCVVWLSLLQWSYGNQSAINNIFLLSHILGIFIPFKYIVENKYSEDIGKSIQWFYFGILITYTFSGLWKWIGLFYKLLFKPNEISWLSPVGSLYNALTGYHSIDYPLERIAKFYSFPLFWQISFVLMTFILTLSFFAAFRQPLRIWIGIALIIFHLVNSIAFDVWSYWFHTAIFVLICLFFPYEFFIKRIKDTRTPIIKKDFRGKGMDARYIRNYANGTSDYFYGFYAYREKVLDNNSFIGGMLYTPFVSILVEVIWKLKLKLRRQMVIE